MADQITHKKQLKKLDKSKRQLLKQYYQLGPDQQPEQNKVEANSPVNVSTSEAEATPEAGAHTNIVITDSTFKQLVRSHNVLLGKEAAASNSIKNTIYENYYDLVEVNKLLGELADPPIEKHLDMLVENVRRIRD